MNKQKTNTNSLSTWNSNTIVTTIYGQIAGRKDRHNTFAWLGIPYASPPVGSLRWKAPTEPSSWSGIKSAKRFGKKPMQKLPFTNKIAGNEDCLYLNIWRPDNKLTNLPVYFWIHGGGNAIGSADAMHNYRGYALASSANIVFVSINYRLNVFGWFTHPSIREGKCSLDDSGNYGTLDIVQALSWVKNNIKAFGGNPDNVSIAGESAGGLNVLSMLAVPQAKGLFHKAMAHSGYQSEYDVDKSDAFSQDLITEIMLKTNKAKNKKEANSLIADMKAEELAIWLRSISSRKILSALNRPAIAGVIEFPNIIKDGAVFPKDGFKSLSHTANYVPLIIGTNKEETKLFAWLGKEKYIQDEYQIFTEFTSARWKARGADAIADMFSLGQNPSKVYLYRFDWGAVNEKQESVLPEIAAKKLGAFHFLDIPFFLAHDKVLTRFFPMPIFTTKNKAGRKDLQAKIQAYIKNFILTGDPNDAFGEDRTSLPTWHSWDSHSGNPHWLVLDATFEEAAIKLCNGRTTISQLDKELETWPEPLKTKMLQRLAKSDAP